MAGLLLKLIPDFDVERHWTSNLRGWARSFDAYKALSDYTLTEVSDITYSDVDGHMTTWLISHGFAKAKGWRKFPTYHIEVKTTTGACGEPFQMSQYQVNLVRYLM